MAKGAQLALAVYLSNPGTLSSVTWRNWRKRLDDACGLTTATGMPTLKVKITCAPDGVHRNPVPGIVAMKRWNTLIVLLMAGLTLQGCTVISHKMMADALTDVSFTELSHHADTYRGQTVILGGHVIEVRNEARQTIIVVLQTPLGSGQEPLPPDRSEGRFMLQHDGFLDPEVFAKGRTLTAAGEVTGVIREAIDHEPYDYILLASREIYLWERTEDLYRYSYPYRSPRYDPWYYRNPSRRYRYR
jgi:outer membrane lipoprotein